MSKIGLFSRQGDTIRAAILRQDTLIHLDGDDLNRSVRYKQILPGRVTHTEKGQYWIDLSPGLGLLSHTKTLPPLTNGQTVSVQISREAFYDKGQNSFKSPLLTRALEQNFPWYMHLINDWDTLDELIIDDAEFMALIKNSVLSVYPDLKITLAHSNCFEKYGIEDEWASLFDPMITASNLNFTIEETSAATIIDINGTGNIITLNSQAAALIAQQIQWRSLSGAIMIEFINHGQDQRPDLIQVLKTGLNPNYFVHGFTKLGFLEISSPRTRAPLHHRFIKKEAK